jgi:hypothetical protein
MSDTSDPLAGDKPTTLVIDDPIAPPAADDKVLEVSAPPRPFEKWTAEDLAFVVRFYRWCRDRNMKAVLFCQEPSCWKNGVEPENVSRVEDPKVGTILRCGHLDRRIHDANQAASNKQARATERQQIRNDRRLQVATAEQQKIRDRKTKAIVAGIVAINQALEAAGESSSLLLTPTAEQMAGWSDNALQIAYKWAVRGRTADRPIFLRLVSDGPSEPAPVPAPADADAQPPTTLPEETSSL